MGSIKKMSSFTLPNKSDLLRSAELINVYAQVDSPVSDIGRDQINKVGERLRTDNFLINENIELVAHSPLLRARQTSEGMLGCVTSSSSNTNEENNNDEDKLSKPVKRVVQLPQLLEKTPSEWIPGNIGSFNERIKEFEAWICNQSETNIAIVGHSQYFKQMLQLDYKFNNCDVWQLTFDCNCNNKDITSATVMESKVNEVVNDVDDNALPLSHLLKKVHPI